MNEKTMVKHLEERAKVARRIGKNCIIPWGKKIAKKIKHFRERSQ